MKKEGGDAGTRSAVSRASKVHERTVSLVSVNVHDQQTARIHHKNLFRFF